MKNYKLIWLGIFCCLQPLILFAQRGETIRKAFFRSEVRSGVRRGTPGELAECTGKFRSGN